MGIILKIVIGVVIGLLTGVILLVLEPDIKEDLIPSFKSWTWKPGKSHKKEQNVVAGQNYDEWKPAEGYRWAIENQGDQGDPRQSRKVGSKDLGDLSVVPIPAPVTKMMTSTWENFPFTGPVGFTNQFDDLKDVNAIITYYKEDGLPVDIIFVPKVWNKGELIIPEKVQAPNYQRLVMDGSALRRHDGEKVKIHYECLRK